MIQARGLSCQINGRDILKNLHFSLQCGERTALLGRNGVGKSALLKLLSGLYPPTAGEILFDGQPLSRYSPRLLAQKRAVLSQQSDFNASFTVEEVVLMGRSPFVKSAETPQDRQIARQAIELTGLVELSHRFYNQLSGGEQQRVQFARMLAQAWPEAKPQPRFLFLDEPTTGLDPAFQRQMLQIVGDFARQQTGVLMILHDLNLAARFADRVLLLQNGALLANGAPAEVLTPKNLRAVYDADFIALPHPQDGVPCFLPAA